MKEMVHPGAELLKQVHFYNKIYKKPEKLGFMAV